jgi:YHS domain-containing protein/plastocyanin
MNRCVLVLAGLVAGIALWGAPADAHDVKDPVCRMTVDADTTVYAHKLGNKTFYFCSKRCQDSFAKEPEKYEKMAEQLEKGDLHEYTAEIKTSPAPVAGQPVAMEFALRYADTRALVQDFEVIHERFVHLIMASEDLSWFEHQHPARGKDGLFRLTWRFPRPGRYTLYADFTPSDGDNQVKPLSLLIGGGPAKTVPLKPDTNYVKQIGNYRVELKLTPASLRMEKAALLTYTLRDRRGRLIRDMQPFIGAMGHMIAISQNGEEVVHTHVLHATQTARDHGGLRVTPQMATEKGPAFSFKLTLPTSGLYKVWAQFMHHNRVLTVPFTFAVADIWAEPSSGSEGEKGDRTGNLQQATIVIDGAYQPASVAVKAGRPVAITFIRKETTGCGDVLAFPSLGLKRALKTGEKTVVTFTPKKAGTISFTCGMSMYRGQVIVK